MRNPTVSHFPDSWAGRDCAPQVDRMLRFAYGVAGLMDDKTGKAIYDLEEQADAALDSGDKRLGRRLAVKAFAMAREAVALATL